MPGLSQLKQFSEDVAKLGNELAIRQERGEPVVEVDLPANISEADDSDDFIFGMPNPDGSAAGNAQESGAADDVLGDLSAGLSDYSAFPELDSLLNTAAPDSLDLSEFPELDAILNSQPEDSGDGATTLGIDQMFGSDSPQPAPPEEPGADTTFDKAIDDLDFGPLDTESEGAGVPAGEIAGDFDLPDFDDDDIFSTKVESPVDSTGFGEEVIAPVDFSSDALDEPALEAGEGPFDGDPVSESDASLNFDMPEDVLGDRQEAVSPDAFADGGGFLSTELPDFDDLDADSLNLDDIAEPSDSFDIPPSSDSLDLPSEGDVAQGEPASSLNAEEEQPAVNYETPDFDDLAASSGGDSLDFNTDSLDMDAGFDSMGGDSSAGSNEGDPLSNMDSFDMDSLLAGEGNSPADSGAMEEEGSLENGPAPLSGDIADFDIPGFSDKAPGTVSLKPKSGKGAGGEEDFTLTDKEYETFLKNLKNYPLNVRIELEKLIAENQFTDEVVFQLVQKVIKKTSARQVATQLEKLLDISIPVPREFERRTAVQYEEYKKSAEYQLKNRILPVALVSLMSACIIFFLVQFGIHFIYKPLKANSLYQEGYALLEEGAYPQSEMKFDEASTYQQQKRWFFKYAEGYRQHKQYERARMIYKAGLQRFNQDKELGLEYAKMELYDLRNFENAEKVVRRQVLDYHLNDKDGMLLLGDIFLEWGDEKDPSKYEAAKQVYTDLIQLHGQRDLYLARMMRYFIRVDDLRNVLQLKAYFYPKKNSLGGEDLIELSGYLLDKTSGNIAPSDEYLLSAIEDVRDLLERAVEAAPDVPESLYNMGLYFINANNNLSAREWLSEALQLFETVRERPRKRVLRQLNTYRLLGNLALENGEHLVAEEMYRTGVGLFEKEAQAGLSGNEDVGRLYAALGDINYLVTNDLDEALRNFTIAVETKYDIPEIRYKIGSIHYSRKEYDKSLQAFVKTAEMSPSNTHVLFALGNVLSVRGDNFAAQGYYQRLMDILDMQRVRYNILFPQMNSEHEGIVKMYLWASNNLGVTLYRLALQTGNSSMNAEALTNFTVSLRAHDALTRNQETMVRLPGTNLAEKNIGYMSQPISEFEPSIYVDIPLLIDGEFIQE